MNKPFGLSIVLLLCIASWNRIAGQTVPSSMRSLQIYFTVSGKADASSVPTLSKLKVIIDKKEIQPTSLHSASDEKLRFALLVDASNSETERAASIREAAFQLFQDLLQDGNEGYLVAFNEQIITSGRPLQLSEVRQALDSVKPCLGSAINDAIAYASQNILSKSGNPETPRRVIILISDGDENASKIFLEKALDTALRENIAIFSLQTAGVKMSWNEARLASAYMRIASLYTGGQSFHPKSLEEGVPLLLDAIHKQWVLSVTSSQVPDQKLHAFSIKSSEKDVQVSAPDQIYLE
jgi:VWFA-related protein